MGAHQAQGLRGATCPHLLSWGLSCACLGGSSGSSWSVTDNNSNKSKGPPLGTNWCRHSTKGRTSPNPCQVQTSPQSWGHSGGRTRTQGAAFLPSPTLPCTWTRAQALESSQKGQLRQSGHIWKLSPLLHSSCLQSGRGCWSTGTPSHLVCPLSSPSPHCPCQAQHFFKIYAMIIFEITL